MAGERQTEPHQLCANCGHDLAEHEDSGWGPNTVCVHALVEPPTDLGDICPCVFTDPSCHDDGPPDGR